MNNTVKAKEKRNNDNDEGWLLDNTEFDYELLDTIFLADENKWSDEIEYVDCEDYDNCGGKDW